MSDQVGEIVALQARFDAELASRPTDRCPPPEDTETAKHQLDAKQARAYGRACDLKSEVDRLVSYLEGMINGVEVDVAQLQPMHPRMAELERKLDLLLLQQGDMLRSFTELSGDVRIVAGTVVDHGNAIEQLRAQHARNHPQKLSVVPLGESPVPVREAE